MSELYCEPCKKALNSKHQWDEHVKSGKHLMKTGSQEKIRSLDMSIISELSDGTYKCKICGDLSSGQIPLQAHLNGQKHLKNVQRSTLPNSLPATAACTTPEKRNISELSGGPDLSCAVPQPNGINYKCTVCDDFICAGLIPMKAHLVGKSHQKKLKLKNFQVTGYISNHEMDNCEVAPKSPDTRKSLIIDHPPSTVEKRIELVWNHPTKCGYEYAVSFAELSLSDKVSALSPHFAFISKDDPIPNLAQYLKL